MIKIIDINAEFIEACLAVGLNAFCDDIMNHAGILVSPANSWGMLDGGIDAVYMNAFPYLQEKVFTYIKTNGEIPVGQAVLFFLDSDKHPYIILAPTMRTPRKLKFEDLHPYLATRAAFKTYERPRGWLRQEPKPDLLIPGMGTGVGQIHPKIAAHQMKMALEDFSMEHPCWACISEREEKLGIIDWSTAT